MLSKLKFLFFLYLLAGSCYGQIPLLNSAPAITNKVIYLDFDGQKVSGTAWNSGNLVNASASSMNAANITLIWKRISEDYRPFDVNITTDSVRFNNAAPNKRIRVIITPTSAWYGSAGGVAYVGSFAWGGTPGTPCWVFENQLGNNTKSIAEAAAHEVGHTLTLRHQSTYNSSCTKTNEYNPGLGTGVTSWAPIMGVGYSKNVTIWHTGTSATGCTTIQNDHGNGLVGITGSNFLSFLPDDVGNTAATAKILNLNNVTLADSGIITQPSDIDAYQFTICSNRYVSFNVKPWALDTTSYSGANLDVRFTLYNSSNSVIAVDTPLTKLHALAGANLSPGTYYFTIDGGRSGNYRDYGSLGKYYINIKATNPPALANTILTNSNICAGQATTLNSSSNGVPTNWFWTISGPTATTFSVQNPNLSFSPAGTYTISLLASNSASPSCPTTITLNIGSNPSLSINNTSSVLCPGKTVTITASGASSYTWLPGAFGGSTQIFSPLTSTNYTLHGSNGTCQSSITTSVNVSPNFTLNVNSTASILCPGKSVTLTASGASSYTFNPGGITSNPAIFTPSVTTAYVVTGNFASCQKLASLTVVLSPTFNLNVAASDTVLCAGESATLIATGAINYTFNPGGLTGYQVVVTPSGTTNYSVTGLGDNGCEKERLITIAVDPCDQVGIVEYTNTEVLQVYPNPTDGLLFIETITNSAELEISNSLGLVVYSKKRSVSGILKIDTQSWASGVYLIRVKAENDTQFVTKRIIKN